MKLGILGTGMIVQMALPALEKLGPEKAWLLARPHSRERAEGLRKQYGLDGIFYDYEQLLAADIDTVYVALPNTLHYEFSKKALLAGKHVILEKPATVRAWELRELERLARERDLILVEAMTIHSLPAYQALGEQLDRAGQLRLAIFNFSQRSSRYDAFLAGDIKPAFDPAQAGGALMDLNVYNLHAILGLFGAPACWDYRANLQRGIDTSGILTLSYPGFQVTALAAKDCGGPSGVTIQGERGCFSAQGPVSGISAFTWTANDGTAEQVRFETGDFHLTRMLAEFKDFQAMIETNDRAEMDRRMAISLKAVEIMDHARRQAGVVFPGDGEGPES